MKKLTQKEKEQLQAMVDKQNAEQLIKQRDYRQHMTGLRKASTGTRGNIVRQRLFERRIEEAEKLERKLQKLRQRTRKRSTLKQMQLTEKEKEELKAKIWGNK